MGIEVEKNNKKQKEPKPYLRMMGESQIQKQLKTIRSKTHTEKFPRWERLEKKKRFNRWTGRSSKSNKEKLQIWKSHLDSLYRGKEFAQSLETISQVDKDEIVDSIMRHEFDQTLKDMKNGKAPVIDDIPVELIK